MKWYAVVDDLIGGWAVATVDKPCSEIFHKNGETVVADFTSLEVAQEIAALHNLVELAEIPWQAFVSTQEMILEAAKKLWDATEHTHEFTNTPDDPPVFAIYETKLRDYLNEVTFSNPTVELPDQDRKTGWEGENPETD